MRNKCDFLPNETANEGPAAGRKTYTILTVDIEQAKFIGHFTVQDRPRRSGVKFGEEFTLEGRNPDLNNDPRGPLARRRIVVEEATTPDAKPPTVGRPEVTQPGGISGSQQG